MTDWKAWVENDPETQRNLRVASTLLDKQGTINDLREKESALAHALLTWRAAVDKNHPGRTRTVPLPVPTAALALTTLLRLCEATKPGTLSPWLEDRVAAADLADALNVRKRDATSVYVDSRSAQRAAEALRYFLAHRLALDPEVTALAATDIETALADTGTGDS